MIKKLFATCCFAFCLIAQIFASPIDSVFVHVPSDILSVLDMDARLDMIDLYNYNMRAEAYNIYGGKSVMTQKTDSMLSISLTESSRWDLALLPQSADTIFDNIKDSRLLFVKSIIHRNIAESILMRVTIGMHLRSKHSEEGITSASNQPNHLQVRLS